ncbi:MAG: hypothetical protein ACTSRP_25825 [Candidatus Helarchaeota archaeon]
MNKGNYKKFLLDEAVNSFDRAIHYAIELDNFKYIFNLLLSAAFYDQLGMYKKTKIILKQILGMNDIARDIKSDIEEFLAEY